MKDEIIRVSSEKEYGEELRRIFNADVIAGISAGECARQAVQ